MTRPPFRFAPLALPARWLATLLLGGALALGPVLVAPALAEPAQSGTTASKKSTTTSKPAARKSTAASKQKAAAKKKAGAKSSTPRTSARKKPATRRGRVADAPGQRDLDRLQAEIRKTEQRIQLTREQREQKEAELRKAEVEIGALKESMGTVQTDVRSREQRLGVLQAEKIRREQDRARLVGRISADLQLAQRQGGDDYYKLLLNQEDPQRMARLMRYYAYVQQARAGHVRELNETLTRLEALTQEERQHVGQLRSLRGELQQKQSKLAVAQERRSQAIRTLSAQIESEDERLQRLRRDEQALQSVMERLAREAAAREQKAREQREREAREAEKRRQQQAATPTPPGEARPAEKRPPEPSRVEEPRDFAPAPYKGRCPLPAGGGVRARFGSARAGGLRWNGVVIDAPAGAPVRAIRPGRVAFADYLRGYGFLIIVDHGRGLMSLYGQNQSLARKAGDNVAGNEVIATVGASGGESDGLYFEIRVRGRPSDPAEWCAYQ